MMISRKKAVCLALVDGTERMTTRISTPLLDIQLAYRTALEARITGQDDQSVIVAHFGEFNQAKNEHLLRISESAIMEQGDKRQSMKRVYSVLVEILQNMAVHATRDRDNRMYGYFILTRTNSHYTIDCGNLTLQAERQGLARRIEQLNTLDPAQLRKAYVDTLCDEDFTDKGGAGLGLLTIGKRASAPIEFRIDPLERPFAYFHMAVVLENA